MLPWVLVLSLVGGVGDGADLRLPEAPPLTEPVVPLPFRANQVLWVRHCRDFPSVWFVEAKVYQDGTLWYMGSLTRDGRPERPSAWVATRGDRIVWGVVFEPDDHREVFTEREFLWEYSDVCRLVRR